MTVLNIHHSWWGFKPKPFSQQPRSALLPIAPLHSSQVFSLSGGVGRPLWQSLLARRASGAVVALAASSLWGVAPEHQTQVPAGHQTHPSTRRGFLGSLVFPLCVFVCVRAPVHVCICRVFVCVWTHGFLYICVQHTRCLSRRTHVSSENRCAASADGRINSFQLRCYFIAVDTSCVR